MNDLAQKFIDRRFHQRDRPARNGLVLVLVLVVVAMLSLAGYAFNELMFSANRASHLSGRQAQATFLVESGVEALKRDLSAPEALRSQSSDPSLQQSLYSGVLVFEDERQGRTGRFSVVTPLPGDEAPTVRFGVANESAKLNLPALVAWDEKQPGVARNALLKLPQMTNEVADSLLDWIDPDIQPREFGSEVDYYAGLDPPYEPRNATVETMEELLLARGVTRPLLLGNDRNRNGVFEPIELAGDQGIATSSSAVSDASQTASMPHQGWSGWLTLSSAEANLDPDGQPKLNLNENDLRKLHAGLLKNFEQPVADFVVLYRQFGPSTDSTTATGTSGTIDWKLEPKHRFATELDVIGARVSAIFASKKEATMVASPLGGEKGDFDQRLPKWLDYVTINPEAVIPGRININLAPPEVLAGIPGLEDADVDAIVSQRGTGSSSSGESRRHPTWLLTEGVLPLEKMKPLLRYITTGGNVHRGQVIGHFDDGGFQARVELVVDASVRPPRIVQWKDLGHQGRAYPESLLIGSAGVEQRIATR